MTKHKPKLHRMLAVTATAGFLLLSGVAVVPAHAEDGPPSGFPSWSDVEQAKGNAAATEAEVAKISQLLDSLDSEAAELGVAAVQAGADFAVAQRQLDEATGEVEILNAQAKRAADQAAEYKKDAVAMAVQSYKNGGTGLGIFAAISALESPDSLNGVDLMNQVGAKAAIRQSRAEESQATAAALEKTREGAQKVRSELASGAQDARDSAVAAQSAVNAQLESKKQQNMTLVAQLASLNNTSVAVAAEYRQGQEALAAYNQAQEAKRKAAVEEAARRAELERQRIERERQAAAAAQPVPVPEQPQAPPAPAPAAPAPAAPNPAAPAPGGYIPVDVLLPNIPGGAVNDPAGAKAFAASQLGSFGWASSEFTCLNLLWERESNWRTNATNPYSGAYGIAQALPPGKYASAGSDWLSNYRTQVTWGLGYIQNRYGSPCGAWNHSQTVGWY